MEMCGYHLRCLNYGNNCSECSYQHEGKNSDYLRDVLTSQPEDKIGDYFVDPDFLRIAGGSLVQGFKKEAADEGV